MTKTYSCKNQGGFDGFQPQPEILFRENRRSKSGIEKTCFPYDFLFDGRSENIHNHSCDSICRRICDDPGLVQDHLSMKYRASSFSGGYILLGR